MDVRRCGGRFGRVAGTAALACALVALAGCSSHLRGAKDASDVFSAGGSAKEMGRGLANVVLSWLEIPKGIQSKVREKGPNPSIFETVTGTVFGAGSGVVNGVERAVGGVYETAMSPFPPYDPLMSPAYPPYLFADDGDKEEAVEKKPAKPGLKTKVSD